MEKASTPRNRLTRSSAKQVNTPKNAEQEESVEKSPDEEIKHNVRKTRRRYDSKAKTNGDAANIENRLNNEDTIEDNMGDKCEKEELDANSKSQDSPKTPPNNTPPQKISRRSLRTRRSSTPGLELESSASKIMKRSSSFGKLDSVSTPTNRRMRRAKSESKDFVFTPSKDKQSGLHDLNSKYIPNAPVRVIEKIDEVNEGEKSSEDEGEVLNQGAKVLSKIEAETEGKNSKSSEKEGEVLNIGAKVLSNVEAETEGNNSKSSEKEEVLNQGAKVLSNVEAETEGKNSKSSEKEEVLNQGAKVLSNLEAETEGKITKSSEKDDIVEQFEIKTISEKSVNETDPSTNPKIEVDDNVIVNDLNPQKVCNGVEILDISQNDSELSNKDNEEKTEENYSEETDANTKVEYGESSQEPCLLSMETETKSPHPTKLAESKSSEICSLAKETLQTNKLQCEGIVMELRKNDEETSQLSDSKVTENPDYEIQTPIEMNEVIHDNLVKTNDKVEVKNIEIEVDDDEPEVSFKQIDEQLQIIMDEGMEESDNEHGTSYSKSDCKINSKTQNETECLEISKIELINSSDSEDGIIEEQTTNVTLMECKNDGIHTENENVAMPAMDKNKYRNETLYEQIETKKEENLSCLVLEEDPQINVPVMGGDQNHQELEKITNNAICVDMENVIDKSKKAETISDQSAIDIIEGDKREDFPGRNAEIPGLYFMDTEPSNSFNMIIENPHTVGIEGSVPGNSASDAQENNFQDPLLQDQSPNLDELHKHNELQEKDGYDRSELRLSDQVTNQSDISLHKGFEPESVDNYGEESYNEENVNENYEDEEFNKSEEGSCDIYKGLSDSGSYDDEKAEGSQSGESLSSEIHSGTDVSEEEYVTSVDDEEENVGEKSGLLNELCSGSIDVKSKELILSRDVEKGNEKNPDSPMTYDKALAIINKNRVKKIDDEEFFDMFTQELNRVSEQSGSDSDIAIIDEFPLETEESGKKNQPKSGNAQNAKQPPRPTGPVLTNQPKPSENYPGDFSQPIHAQHGHPIPIQHSHPAMQRVNFTQGALYQQFDQNMHLRGQLMYNQYAHPSSSMQDPHIFNPPVAHPDVNFSSGVFNHPHPLGPVSESSFPPNNTSLKVRSVTDMNMAPSVTRNNYRSPDQAKFDERNFEHQEGKDSYLNMSSTSVAEVLTASSRPNNSDPAIRHEPSDKKVDNSRTPILDLLGLDKKSLKLLKKVLGLNSIKRKLMKRDLDWQKKCLERSICKSELRQRGRKKETRYRNIKRFTDSDSSSLKSSSEQSSEESSTSSSGFSKARNYGSSSENDNREVNVEDGSVYVTLKTKNKSKHKNEKELFRLKKVCLPSQQSFDTIKQKNKTKSRRKPRSSAVELNSKKMAQKHTSVVKSQSGTFTVDPMTASSQSSDSEFQSVDDKLKVQELKRKLKRDLASGKNKLSNMFAHSSTKSKVSKGKVSEPFQEIKGPLRKENLKELRKLPSEILETLAKEDKKKKRHRTEESGSDDVIERPKKIRKKSQKMKVKSKAGDQNYIPCVTSGATEFGLSRLDKDGTLTLAEKAAKFRTDQLYGASVKRITILDFKHQWC